MVHCSKFVVLFQKFSSFFIGSNTTNLRLIWKRNELSPETT